MPDEFLFVYGTLRQEFALPVHDLMKQHCRFHDQGSMYGHLYQVDGYPGVIVPPHCRRRVHGELYRIIDEDALFLLLDDYEQCSAKYPKPHEYVREQIDVTTSSGAACKTWTYIYNRPVAGLARIHSGDYVSHMRGCCKVRYNAV
ncbi:gamma-glutamylcyclotransferase family protein [Methylobacter sp. YRD-M1]|uniref:gamma-glutamylcyclotransferase family protein n=1 Tax=Methylobacter sp. YRD-M1 TaxID=2911520 RepID=UPI00227D6E5D|nr:gamma-glutamylcyclotransferase family protein [Methylobacter sp. YRD-M1]WAK04083.1 gamma-glutamylcyclotransferase [Methylobacter sp. YRD-M1]